MDSRGAVEVAANVNEVRVQPGPAESAASIQDRSVASARSSDHGRVVTVENDGGAAWVKRLESVGAITHGSGSP